MALTLSQLVEAIAKYEDRLTGSAHDKAAFTRNIDLLRGRVTSVATAIRALAEPTFEVPSDYFEASGDDAPYLIGGSPNNPNGVTFTPSLAVAWWTDVFGHGYNIGKVRSALTPGSHVLTPDGLAAAQFLGKTSINFAPEDYNPLGLEVIA